MHSPLVITLQQQSQQFQTESTRLIKLVEQLFSVKIDTVNTSAHAKTESDNTHQSKPLLSHPTPTLLSQTKTLNDEQSKRLGDLQTVLNECVVDLTQRELEIAKTENSILKQQHEMAIQLSKKEVELAKLETDLKVEYAEKNAQLSQKELTTGENRYHSSDQRRNIFPIIAPFDSFPNSRDQFSLVDDFNQYDIVGADSSKNHTLSPVVSDNNIKSLAVCFSNYNSNKNDSISTINSTLGHLVYSTVKEVQGQFHINRDRLHTSEEKIKQQQTTANKREQAIIKREKVVNSQMDEQLKPIRHCLSHNMKTWEGAEAQRKKNEVGKDKKDQTRINLVACWKITNLNKQVSLTSVISDYKEPLLASLYKTGRCNPIFEHFLKNDYESGKIPKLADNLKLYFSAPHVMGGKWIQFHGPGSCFQKNGCPSGTVGCDGNNNDIVLSHFSLCDFNKKKPVKSTTDLDRCDLSPDECKKRHKSTDKHYVFYHSPPTEQYTTDFVIEIKWD
jgi:hypothetical protein